MTTPVEAIAGRYDVPAGVVRLILGSYGVATGALMVAGWCIQRAF